MLSNRRIQTLLISSMTLIPIATLYEDVAAIVNLLRKPPHNLNKLWNLNNVKITKHVSGLVLVRRDKGRFTHGYLWHGR